MAHNCNKDNFIDFPSSKINYIWFHFFTKKFLWLQIHFFLMEEVRFGWLRRLFQIPVWKTEIYLKSYVGTYGFYRAKCYQLPLVADEVIPEFSIISLWRLQLAWFSRNWCFTWSVFSTNIWTSMVLRRNCLVMLQRAITWAEGYEKRDHHFAKENTHGL